MADDPIARRARALFADKRRGNLVRFSLKQLEKMMRHSHAVGRGEMAEKCARAVIEAAATAPQMDLTSLAAEFYHWAAEATAEERLER